MTLEEPLCPECGKSAVGTVDLIPGYAIFDGDPCEDAVEYSGTTDVNWDGQRPVMLDGKPTVFCEDGHRWATKIEGLDI